jgi:hypothetical protein
MSDEYFGPKAKRMRTKVDQAKRNLEKPTPKPRNKHHKDMPLLDLNSHGKKSYIKST